MNRVAVIGIVGNSAFLGVERFHEGGETVHAESLHFELGGKGFNQAVAAARMGASVSFLGAVGREYRREIEDFMKQEGIDGVLVPKSAPTAFAAILTDRTGANRTTVYGGAELGAQDVALFQRAIAEADVLLLNNEVDERVNLEASRIAAEHGVRIILNPAPARETDAALLDRVSLFTPNEHEAVGLEGRHGVIQTLGKKGCLIRDEGTLVPALCVKAVDTTGAGDTFNGALAAELAVGKSLYEAVCLAIRASGLSVTGRGAVGSMPYRRELGET